SSYSNLTWSKSRSPFEKTRLEDTTPGTFKRPLAPDETETKGKENPELLRVGPYPG
ncbi:unnamed protein product, partial [Allacma fusca]